MYQILAIKIMAEEYLGKGENCMQPSWKSKKHMTELIRKLSETF